MTGGRAKRVGKPRALNPKGKRLKGSGTLAPSPDRLARTRVNWMGVELPSTKGDYGKRVLPVEHLAKSEFAHRNATPARPLLVHFFTEDGKEDAIVDYAQRLWRNDSVGLASRLFNCYRISIDDMDSAADRKRYGKRGPLILLLSPEGKKLATLPGWKVTERSLLTRMRAVVRSRWKQDLNRLLLKHAKLLAELDEVHRDLEKAKRTLVSTEEHVKVHNCAPGQKRLVRTKAEIKELEKRRAAAFAAERSLYAFAASKSQAPKGSN